jgi:uncharacterized protein (TIGR03437 family)
VDILTRSAVELPKLGPWENKVHEDTVLVASSNGAAILAAQADGSVLIYDANVGDFTIWRKDFEALSGAYAASGSGRFVVDNHLLNSSGVEVQQLETGTGKSSGFVFADDYGLRTTAVEEHSPGVIQRIDLASSAVVRPTRTAEAPCLGTADAPFTRTLAALPGQRAIVVLGYSGLVVLPWAYEASVPAPKIDRVVNAADMSSGVAPGSLISVLGSNLSPVNAATSEMPLPTAIGESCLTANGVPVPMLFVSGGQVNAQLPYYIEGDVTLVLRTPGGPSDNFNMTVDPAAPGVFRASIEGTSEVFPTIVRARNNLVVTLANPIHRGDTILIFAAGLGRTFPEVEAGMPAPEQPLALASIPPVVDLGGVELPVYYAGLAPGWAGVYQINAIVPSWVPTGMSVPLTIRQSENSTTVSVRVVQ